MPHTLFDRDKLHFKKLSGRRNKVDIVMDNVNPDHPSSLDNNETVLKAAGRIRNARKPGRSVMLTFGAHTIKNGLAPVLISLLENGWVTHMATNGAGIIHDWEFAFQGKSSEDVRENVRDGMFGMWEETGFYINLALCTGAWDGSGYGEAVGKMIHMEGLEIPDPEFLRKEAIEKFRTDPDRSAAAADLAGIIGKFSLEPGFMKIPHPFRQYSVQAAAYRLGIPFTGHPMIGHDIIYTHPANHGASVGRTAARDFLSFAESVGRIDNGVYISLGSAVMSPMIFEKSLSMSQNRRISEGSRIDGHYMLVVDLARSDWDWNSGEPPADNPAYYLRYCKTFSRMGGEMEYLSADNREFLLALHHALK